MEHAMLEALLVGLDEETAGASNASYTALLRTVLLSQVTMSRGKGVGDLVALLNSPEQLVSLVSARRSKDA